MKLLSNNGKIIKVNHPSLPAPMATQPLPPAPRPLITEKKLKKP
jgi:hypothetical protein